MPLESLLNHLKQTAALSQAAGILSWDQEAMMPPKGAQQRAEQAGALAAVIHEREADPRVPEWISNIDIDEISDFDRANIREARRAYDRATMIPARLAQELAKAASEGQQIWAKARADNKFADFAPSLARTIKLKREEAACLSAGGDAYDALLDQFEPGAKAADLAPLLEGLRPRLTALREKIAEKPVPKGIEGEFAKGKQMGLSRKVARHFGYDLDAGRLDTVTHPFCSGSAGDVRITTRVDEAEPLGCLYSTIHETGHALYAQGAPDAFLPAMDYCSMGVHESQSRFWENQIARSRPFMDWLHPAMTEAFGEVADGPDALYAAVNRVETGFIRTEADEVHYNLHILLRFELERELIAGALEVGDLEAAWNERFERDFGVAVPEARLGVLQDVHWSVGLFGYFPTYSLGNLYAACLDKAIRAALPDCDEMVRKNETGPILGWLRKHIHERGRLAPAGDLIADASGAPPSSAPLLDYLETKFSALYDL